MSNKSLKKVKFVKIVLQDEVEEQVILDEDAEESDFYPVKKIKIKKLPLGRYAQVMDELQRVPGLLEAVTQSEDDNLFELLPKLVKDFWEDMIGIVSIATRLDEEFLNQHVDLQEGVELVKAVIEVNNFFGVGQDLKGMLPGLAGTALTQIGKAAKSGYKKSLRGSDEEASESEKSSETTTPTN